MLFSSVRFEISILSDPYSAEFVVPSTFNSTSLSFTKWIEESIHLYLNFNSIQTCHSSSVERRSQIDPQSNALDSSLQLLLASSRHTHSRLPAQTRQPIKLRNLTKLSMKGSTVIYLLLYFDWYQFLILGAMMLMMVDTRNSFMEQMINSKFNEDWIMYSLTILSHQ